MDRSRGGAMVSVRSLLQRLPGQQSLDQPGPRYQQPWKLWGVLAMTFTGISLLAGPGAFGTELPAKPAAAGPAIAETSVIPVEIKRLLQDRDYPAAVVAIDQALAVPEAARDQLLYLKARALHLAADYDAAVAVYAALEQELPDSGWVRRARFGRAVSLARKGDFRAAELIYREESSYLLSGKRKQELAAIYLEFADGYFKPHDENVPPDYQKALEFFQKALEVGPLPETRAEVELKVAQCFQSLGNLAEASTRYAQFAKTHTGNALVIEALFRLGESQLAEGKRDEARRTWQDLLTDHADAKSARIAEARYRIAMTHGVPAPENSEELSLGVAALEAFLKAYPDHPLAALAQLQVAQSYLHHGRVDQAIDSLKSFIANAQFAKAEQLPEARILLGRSYRLRKDFDQALATWREYLTLHPSHQGWNDVQQAIIDIEYQLGAEAVAAKHHDAARRNWSEFLVKYPLDPRNPRILFEFGQMNFTQEKWEEALADWRRVVSKYPGSNEASQAQFMIAVTLEEKLKKLADALKEYRKLDWGDHATQARVRAARLTAKDFTVVTERVFRTNETPKIRFTSRNIEAVTVRAYTVDLETYFRKMHLASGVEALDISLIDPDQSFEFKIPDYAQYRLNEHEIEVPLPAMRVAGQARGGVMAVTVSSQTLEATTMVIQSDLDVIVKGSREEVFVFAQNMRTGQPWPGARLLVSSGSQVFLEGETGADGVFQQTHESLKSEPDIRVFAIAAGSVASNQVDLQGFGIAQGLKDKGYIYTDRPAYRAGQIVHVRGLIRLVEGDLYRVPEGAKYKLEVFDERNRLVRQEAVELGGFGSFHCHFTLPDSSYPGTYRLQLSNDENQSFQGSFVVHQRQLEPVRLSVDAERKVFYRGEEIEGKIVVKFYYGAPIANRDVTYQLAGGRSYSGRTNEQGELSFKLPTREYRESQVLPLVVTLPERNLSTAVNFYLAVQGYSIDVSTTRSVFVAGETFEVTTKVLDAEGKPLAQALTLDVLQRTVVEGVVVEQSVEKHELKTADDGQVRTTLRLEKGADYVLRVEGIDRFDHPVAQSHLIKVSDDQDTVRLRILADKHTFKEGDTAAVQLHWREAPALALVTYQGARVLGYQLVELQTGANELPLPMTAAMFPNFELNVAVMTDARAPADQSKADQFTRFHTASSPFTVERDLRIKLTYHRAGEAEQADAAEPLTIQPGDELEVTVETHDAQGNPVAAELSLAMVEQSLLEMFGSPLGPIKDFFRGEPRAAAVGTTSSVTFSYRPTTRPINSMLLAETDRLALAAEEAERRTALEGMSGQMGGGQAALGGMMGTLADDHLHALPQLVSGDMPAPANQSAGGSDRSPNFSDINGQDLAEGAPHNEARMFAKPISGEDKPRDGRADPGSGYFDFETAKKDGFSKGQFIAGFTFQTTDESFDSKEATVRLNTPQGMRWYFGNGGTELGVLHEDGVQTNLALRGRYATAESAGAKVRALQESGARLVPAELLRETGFWHPAIVTDEQGTATLTLTVPDRATAWRLLARGMTASTAAGELELDWNVKKDLFGDLKLPLAFTDGDQAQVIAEIHNNLLKEGTVEATLKTTIGGRTVEELKKVEVTGLGMIEVPFKVALQRPAAEAAAKDSATTDPMADVQVVFELLVTTGDRREIVRRTTPLLPSGMTVHATASGVSSSDATAWVELPAEMSPVSPRLEITVGPTVEAGLLDILTGVSPGCHLDSLRLASGLDSTTSDLLAAIGLQQLFKATRDSDHPQLEMIDARIRAAISQLVSSQLDDGGWSWTGRAGSSDRLISSRVVWALSLAKAHGYTVADSSLEQGLSFLTAQIAATAEADYESKAILLQGLASAGRGDFTLANRLYRNRPALSNSALAHLALALVQMERLPMASDLLKSLDERLAKAPAVADGPKLPAEHATSLPWSHSEVELRALMALALEKTAKADPRTKAQVDWLLARRAGFRWSPDKATGPATLALCEWFAQTRFEQDHYQLTILVNGLETAKLDIKPGTTTQSVAVPMAALQAGKQRVQFQLTGRGRFTYQCLLTGYVPTEKLKSTTKNWIVRRRYEPAPKELDGLPVRRGFDIVTGSYRAFSNTLTQLPVGERGLVELDIHRQYPGGPRSPEQQEYLVVTEPIPSGATVIEQSVQGNFERFEIGPGGITFYIGQQPHVGQIRYEIHGYLPGEYHAGPTVVRDAYQLDQLAVAEAKTLAVLPLGAKSGDEYKLSPLELYDLGKRYFDKGDHAAARVHLADLLAHWQLQPEPYQDAVRMLLDIHLEAGPASEVVRLFEIFKEKWPELEIPFEKIVKVGAAYHEIGEYERAYLVFRATVESSFLRETGVPGFLEGQGEFLRSVEVMGRLLAEYPPEGYMAAAEYALAQRVYAYGAQAAADPKLREKKINRVDLIQRAVTMLDRFLTTYPNDPAADQGAFSLANALLELKLYRDAITASNAYAARYPESDYLDSYWYIVGYSHFALGEHDEALKMCQKVAESKRVDPATGRETESRNKWRAIYILAQVHHSLGEAAAAIADYTRVQDHFADAKKAIEYFARQEISVPEVTTLRPGEPANMDLQFRNVAQVDVRVYRIDLMKFSLLKQNLTGITQINLAGIRPFHEATLPLGDGKDYRDRQQEIPLPVKEEGAYLVVLRGNDLHASGLVLVSPLEVQVQQEASSGEVRTTVKNVGDDEFVANVHVKVIGTRNPDFVSGETDLRGVFVADSIRGTTTVIAQADGDRYAFFRGNLELGPVEPTEPLAAPAPPQAGAGKSEMSREGELLDELQNLNYDIQTKQNESLQDLYRSNRGGVRVKEAH